HLLPDKASQYRPDFITCPVNFQIIMKDFIKIKLVPTYTGIDLAGPLVDAAIHIDDVGPTLPTQPCHHLGTACAVVTKDDDLSFFSLGRGGKRSGLLLGEETHRHVNDKIVFD